MMQVYISIDTEKRASMVVNALHKLFEGLELDMVGVVKVQRITAQRQRGRHDVSDKATWDRRNHA